MNRYTYVILFLFFFNSSLTAQNPTVEINTGRSCAGKDVLLSITASNLSDIGAILLYVDIDPAKLTFLSLENINPQLEDLNYNFIQDPPRVAVAWSNIVPANFPQTKLFDLKFQVSEVTTPVSFAPGCEIATIYLQPITINWLNGAVEPANPVLTSQPEDVTIGATKNASFAISSANATGYQWERSQDNGTTWQALQDEGNYNGTRTNQLQVTNIPFSFNKTKYRCIAGNEGCYTVSDAATLTVTSSASIGEEINNLNIYLKNQPNPFTDYTNIEYNLPDEGNVHIRVYSMIGNMVVDLLDAFQSQGQHKIPLFTSNLAKGIYVLKFEFVKNNASSFIYLKMLKN